MSQVEEILYKYASVGPIQYIVGQNDVQKIVGKYRQAIPRVLDYWVYRKKKSPIILLGDSPSVAVHK